MCSNVWKWLGVLSLVAWCLVLPPLHAQPLDIPQEDWTADASMLLYFEAITQMRKNALQPLTSQQIVRRTLKTYLRSLDPFSDYLSPEEYADFQRLQQSHYAGVGMDISQAPSGYIVCLPYPQSPAAKAGIAAGDVLKAVDGVSVVGQSVLTIGSKIRGQPGTTVRLHVANKTGAEKHVAVARSAVEAKSVLVKRHEALPVVRILSFTNTTPRELQETFRTLPPSKAVVLDLRGNPGGSLYDAIDAAMLFLDNGQHVARIQTRAGPKDYYRDRSMAPITVPLYLWQDAWTASAAELFIAALHHNHRAASIGTKTFGKGTMQQLLALADGSALYLTTGYLQTPDGTSYHERGLDPMYPLAMAEAQTKDYAAQVLALLKQHVATSLSPSDLTRQVGPVQPTTPPEHVELARAPIVSRLAPLPSTPWSEPDALLDAHLLCFDKDFDSEQSAHTWSEEVRAVIRERFEYYALQRQRPEGIAFVVCLGPFKNQDEAAQKRPTIAEIVSTAMFTTVVEQALPSTFFHSK